MHAATEHVLGATVDRQELRHDGNRWQYAAGHLWPNGSGAVLWPHTMVNMDMTGVDQTVKEKN